MPPYSVVFSCPYPPDECLKRLIAVTTDRGQFSWYLDSRTATRPDPRLHGFADSAAISVKLFRETGSGRSGQAPWLRASAPQPAAGGKSTISGTIEDPRIFGFSDPHPDVFELVNEINRILNSTSELRYK